ncbi:MAG TPA: prepilin-type N-terminal cleavage/methylation domain-containing protein [Armatimonadota bacterium]|nr:prepilin-type N-terminal cleavage/methylation domain-containing protein [Armatimonadota bacterium]
MTERSSRRGFTLIELLVVLTIIAVLVAILLPLFLSVREHARQTTCMNNLAQLSKAQRLYADDHGGVATGSTFASASYNTDPPPNQVGYDLHTGAFWRYLKTTKIFLCPSDKGRPGKLMDLSYSQNSRVNGQSLDEVKHPGRCLLVIHEMRETLNDGSFIYYSGNIDRPTNIHHGGACLSYCDMHVTWQHYNALEAVRRATGADDFWNPEN